MANGDGVTIGGNLDLPIFAQVALGLHPGVLFDSQFGYNPQIDTTTDPEDVWQGGGLYTGMPQAGTEETVTVVSTSTADTITGPGTGAHTVKISGLDGTYAPVEETIDITGQVAVTTTQAFWRINRVDVTAAGTSMSNEGTITVAMSTTTANVMQVIAPDFARSTTAAFTVPAGYTGLLLHFEAQVSRANNAATSAQVHLMYRIFGSSVWLTLEAYQAVSGSWVQKDLIIPHVIPEKADIRVEVHEVGSSASVATASIGGIMIPNGHL